MSFSWARALSWLIALVVGAVYGLAGTMTHAATWGVLPVGVVVALAAAGALLLAIRLLTSDRIATVAAGLGMIAVALVLSQVGPGGSVVVANGPLGLAWTIGLPCLVVLVAAWPSLRTRPREGN